MGQGVILGNLGSGKYQVRILRDFARAEAEKNAIDGKILVLEEEVLKLQDELVVIQNELDTIKTYVDSLITQEAAQPGIDDDLEKQITVALKQLAKKALERNLKQLDIDTKELIIESKKKKKTQITNAIATKQNLEVDAWCVDYVVDIPNGTTVGLLEVPDETMGYTPSTNIKPGGNLVIGNETDPTYIQPTISSGPPAVFYNLALLPGVQKWKPHYRKGTITSFGSGDYCNVTLDDAYSSQHPKGYDLSVNKTINLFNVPIVYQTCNAAAFQVNDRVIVDFQGNPDTPRVIGFVDHPRECPSGEVTYRYEDWKMIWVEIYGFHTNITETLLFRVNASYRIDPDPQAPPINPLPVSVYGETWNNCHLYVKQKYGFISADAEQNHIFDEVYFLSASSTYPAPGNAYYDFDIEATFSRSLAYIEHRRWKKYPNTNVWIYDGIENIYNSTSGSSGSFTWSGSSINNLIVFSGGSFSFSVTGGPGYATGVATGSQGLTVQPGIDVSGQYDLGPYLYKKPDPNWIDDWTPNQAITSGNIRQAPATAGDYGLPSLGIIQSTATRNCRQDFDATEASFWVAWSHGVTDWTPNTAVTAGEARLATENYGGFSIGQVIISKYDRTTLSSFNLGGETINWRAEGPLLHDLDHVAMQVFPWSTFLV